MPDIRILLLGTPEVQIDGKVCLIPRRVNRAVLFYLASQGHSVSRNALLALFWPEHNEVSARARLRETLSRLGKSLPGALETDPVRVTLNFRRVYVDQLHFEKNLNEVGGLPWQISKNDPLPPAVYNKLRQAIELWRGPRFIHGEDFPGSLELDNWLSLTNQRLSHQYLRVLERLSDHARVVNNPEECLQLARRALLIDQINEDWHVHLLECLIAMGRWNEGLEHYNFVESLYRREHLLPLSNRLKSISEQLRQGANPIEISEREPAWNVRTNIITPFVGRKQTLEELNSAFHLGGGVVILGESGLGKTRLMQEFSARITPRPRILLAICRSGEAVLPFQPFIELLRENVQPEEWANLAPSWIQQLSLLLPEFQEQAAQVTVQRSMFTSESTAIEARSQLMEAIRQVFLILARKRKLLFCVDDAHWADEASLATITYLLARPPFDSGLLIIAARREEHSPALEVLLNNLQQLRNARIIRLPYLNQNEIIELVSYITGSLPKEALIMQLIQETGGNPLYLIEMLRALQEYHSTTPEKDIEAIPITLNLRNVIASRLRTLSQFAIQILQVAAVIGVEFSPEIVRAVSNIPAQELNRALEELDAQQLILPELHPDHEVRYRFIHSLIREVLLDEIQPIRKQWLHRQVALYLESSGTSEDARKPAILARHYELGGEGLLSFEYWVKAGQYARQLFSLPEANNAFANADGLIPYITNLPEEKAYDLFTEWAEMAYESEDLQTILQLSERLTSLGIERTSNLYLGTALNLSCQADMIQNAYETGLSHASRAISLLSMQEHRAALMEAHIHRGTFLYMLNQVNEARVALQTALSIAPENPTRAELRARGNTHYQIAFLEALAGWPRTGLHHARLSLQDFTEIRRSYGLVMAYSVLALNTYLLGEFDQSRIYYHQGLELAERTQAYRMLGYLQCYAGMVELTSGNLDACLYHAQKCIEIGERWKHAEITSQGYRLLGDIYFWLGVPEASDVNYQKAIEVNQDHFMAVDAIHRYGLLLYSQGRKQEGLNKIERSMNLSQKFEIEGIAIQIHLTEATRLKMDGDWEGLRRLAGFIQKEAFLRNLIPIRLLSTLYLGEAAFHQGKYHEAATHLLSVAEEATRLPYVWVAIPAWIELSHALQRIGIPDPSLLLRVEVLLERIDQKAHHPSIRAAFENFAQRQRNNLHLIN